MDVKLLDKDGSALFEEIYVIKIWELE